MLIKQKDSFSSSSETCLTIALENEHPLPLLLLLFDTKERQLDALYESTDEETDVKRRNKDKKRFANGCKVTVCGGTETLTLYPLYLACQRKYIYT